MLFPHLLEPCPILPFITSPPPPASEQLFLSNFGVLVLLSQGGAGYISESCPQYVSALLPKCEQVLHPSILFYTILYYTILYYTILYYTILYYTILYYTILYYTILYYTILYYAFLYEVLGGIFGLKCKTGVFHARSSTGSLHIMMCSLGTFEGGSPTQGKDAEIGEALHLLARSFLLLPTVQSFLVVRGEDSVCTRLQHHQWRLSKALPYVYGTWLARLQPCRVRLCVPREQDNSRWSIQHLALRASASRC